VTRGTLFVKTAPLDPPKKLFIKETGEEKSKSALFPYLAAQDKMCYNALFVRRFIMKKMKIKYGFIVFLLLMACFNPSLSAKDNNLKFFLNLTTGSFKAFAFGAGAELKIYKFVSIKPSIDLPANGGRIIYFDTVFTLKSSKKLKPFFTVGYLDYYFEGNASYDRDEVKSITFGFGVNFYSKKDKAGSSLGVKIANADGTSFPIIYLNLVLFRL